VKRRAPTDVPLVASQAAWQRRHRAHLLEIARTLHGYFCQWDDAKGVWQILSGNLVVAEWAEDRVPGLGGHLNLQLVEFQMLAIAHLLQRETSRAGGRKTVKQRRPGQTKSDKILRALATQPSISNTALAERFGCDVSLVQKLRNRQGKA
jgi:hypothetical protein